MAVDPEKFRNLRDRLDVIADIVDMDPETREFIENQVFGEELREVEKLLDESRPPRLYVFGRSGAGKSSLINALANKDEDVADVGAVEPTTVDSTPYEVEFSDRYASWEVVDSRGLFESVSPTGDVPADTIEFMKQDLEKYRPDILLHVVTPDQVRAGEEDFKAIQNLREEIDSQFPPIVYCLNKVDSHMAPGDEWPPHENPSLQADIEKNMDFLSEVLEKQVDSTFETEPIRDDTPLWGYTYDSKEYIGVVPVFLQQEPYWNVSTLSWLIGDFLPTDARLQFAQGQRREELMRDLAKDVRKRFSTAAAGIGGAPTPVADAALLTPLQMFMVGIIGTLSCREFTTDTIREYLSAMGLVGVGGLAAREIARALIQFIPGAGSAVSASIAGGTTWAMGESAEKFYFDGVDVEPSSFLEEGKKRFQ